MTNVCDFQSTKGTIISFVDKGLNSPSIVTVQYEVDQKIYQITETLKYEMSKIKFLGLPIGQKKSFKLKSFQVGAIVEVKYCLSNHADAYIVENEGIINN